MPPFTLYVYMRFVYIYDISYICMPMYEKKASFLTSVTVFPYYYTFTITYYTYGVWNQLDNYKKQIDCEKEKEFSVSNSN